MACRGEVLQGKGTKQKFRDEMLPSYGHVGPMGSGGDGVWEMPQGSREKGRPLTCRVVDRRPCRIEWILWSRTTRRVHEARLWGCRTSFGVLGVGVYWLHWNASHRNLLA